MCCSDRIVRVTYPKKCCPEINDSQQLIYNGPALACVDVQTNQTFNDAIKEIDALICNTLNSLTTTTTTTIPPCGECYSVYNPSLEPSIVSYTPCGFAESPFESILPNGEVYICSSTFPELQIGLFPLVITPLGSLCNENIECILTTTTTTVL